MDEQHRLYMIRKAALVSFAGPDFTVTKTLPRGILQGFLRPGPCDYIGCTNYERGNKPIRFDLKSSTSKTALDLRVSSGKLKKHQLRELVFMFNQCPGALHGILARRACMQDVTWWWLPTWWLVKQGDFSWAGEYVRWDQMPDEFKLGRQPDYLDTAMGVASEF